MDDADMGVWSYQYNALGELTRQTDARNNTSCFYYDALGRMNGKYYASTTSCPTSPTMSVSYGYDSTASGNLGYGQRTSMTDGSGTTSWHYDVRGRMVEELRSVTGMGSFKTAWGYNNGDMVTAISYPDGNTGNSGETVGTTYLTQGSVFAVVGNITYASNSKYDAAGRLLTQERKSKTQKLTQSYFDWATANGVGRLQTIQAGTSASPASYLGLAYTYDPLGNVATAQETTNSSQVQTFSYDALSRLTAVTSSNFGSGAYNETYSYNATTGNLATKAGYTHSYADTNHPHAVTQATNGTITNSYEYDWNGNMSRRILNGTVYTLTYDPESRLTSVTGGSTSDSYTYDGDGSRILVVSGGVTTVYIGDYYEYTLTPSTGSGGEEGGEGPPPPPTVSTRAYYYAGSQRIAMRNPASATGSTGLTMLYGDHLGSASVAVDGSNNVTRMRYKAWGEARGTSASAFVTDRLFTGQVYDGDVSAGGTGLYYYNARMYDPALGRFTQADTIVPEPSRPLAFDRYAYVYNNPVRYSDPSGHCIFAGVDTIACLLVALKILDYGWTAWDMWQAGRTIASPNPEPPV